MRATGRRSGLKRKCLTVRTAFEFFNRTLFAGQLPSALVTLQPPSDRYRGCYNAEGLFCRNPRANTAVVERIGEISLDPEAFVGRTDREMLSVLVHEMTHHWQQHFGKPIRRNYHNREWAGKMEALGLMPSATGQPGGKRTGQAMTHYIVPGGPFARACKQLLSGGVRLARRSSAQLAGRDGGGARESGD